MVPIKAGKTIFKKIVLAYVLTIKLNYIVEIKCLSRGYLRKYRGTI